jgi:hypothetical protein
MRSHLQNRVAIIESLKAEVHGPDPGGEILTNFNPGGEPHPIGRYRYQWKEGQEPEEILRNEPPNMRYGAGVLYPVEVSIDESEPQDLEVDDRPLEAVIDSDRHTQQLIERNSSGSDGLEEDGVINLDLANVFKQSSLGVSFVAECVQGETLSITASLGRYEKRQVHVVQREPGDSPQKSWLEWWYIRQPVTLEAKCDLGDLLTHQRIVLNSVLGNNGPTSASVTVFCRSLAQLAPSKRLLTVVLENSSPTGDFAYDQCLFQVDLGVAILSKEGRIHAYPRPDFALPRDEEQQSLDVLYRDYETFAVGHGCSATWDDVPLDHRCSLIRGHCFPTYEAPSIAFDLFDSDGQKIQISMGDLAQMEIGGKTYRQLSGLAKGYEEWIDQIEMEGIAQGLNSRVVQQHIADCRQCADRISDGLELLRSDERALRAFRLANEAMLWQGLRSKLNRPAIRPGQGETWSWGNYPREVLEEGTRRDWRPFQIAFLLMSLRSASDLAPIDNRADFRETVDLIWFPTGGGKTEAYLGLTAYILFFNRILESSAVGTQVLMRYTLRLLTQQQVERAASLMCAMEFLRVRLQLPGDRFTVGIWAGSDFVPNKCFDAASLLGELGRQGHAQKNLLILTKCPWCGAEIGVKSVGQNGHSVFGAYKYTNQSLGSSVRYACPDSQCRFRKSGGMGSAGGENLPVYFIDEEMYERPPSVLIATVDKFATMHLQPKARSFFGLKATGDHVARTTAPPRLIIQDELHLMSGPLGSVVGLYEGLLERLCLEQDGAKPKIVCSTATTRAYREQVRGLFGRKDTRLFPSPGTTASDSFFARYAKDKSGKQLPGKIYVGLLPTSYTSTATARVRTILALAQAPVKLSDELAKESADETFRDCARISGPRTCHHLNGCLRIAQDPWWTNLIFFNSLRELGNAIALFQSDIPDWRTTMVRRLGYDNKAVRSNVRLEELTSRLRHDEVPKALSELAITRSDTNVSAIGACLASTIIEVGIDVDRLSLMTVLAQPKTTATYIQVTGRVGRSWRYDTQEGAPGLVTVLFGADRPRDRSHFERFRSYHERLYAQVEPSSLTPFAPPVLERALHGIYCAFVRLINNPRTPSPYPAGLVPPFIDYLKTRIEDCAFADQEKREMTRIAKLRLRQWQDAPPAQWAPSFQIPEDQCLLKGPTGDPTEIPTKLTTPWPTPTSMRNVDAEVGLAFTQWFTRNNFGDEGEGEDEWGDL